VTYEGDGGGQGDAVVGATPTKSNAIAEAVKQTLIDHLAEFLTLPTGFGADSFHAQSGVTNMKAGMAPAIWIDDRGEDDKEPGNPPSWPSAQTYSFDIEIWDRCDGAEYARTRMNTWRDTVQACLNQYWWLGYDGRRANCDATKGDPAVLDGGGVGSDQLWMSMVRATVEVMVASGSATL
jgi:hypothetical protein